MNETTVYLTDDLKHELERFAAARGQSEAEMILEGIRMLLALQLQPLPTFGLFDSGDPDFAARTEELLEGFGEH